MANIFPSSPPPLPSPGSRFSSTHARRGGIALFVVAVVIAGVGHVIGLAHAGVIAGAVAGSAVLVFIVRKARSRRSGGLPPGLRGGLPRGLGRPGFPRGLPRGTLRIPRGVGRSRLPPGMRPPLPRGMRAPASARSRSRMPGPPGRSRPGGLGRSGARPRGALAGKARPRAAGSPAFRPARSSARAGALPGTSGRRHRAGGSTARAGAGRRPGTALGGGTRGSAARARRAAASPGRVRGWRRAVPPRMRPAAWTGGTAAPARGWRRLVPRSWRPAAPGTVPRPRARRGFRRPSARPPRVRVRGGRAARLAFWRRWRPRRPRPVRTHRRRPFSQAWVLHHVRRFGRWRVRRKAARRQPLARPGPFRGRRPRRIIRGVRKMQAFLIAWRSRKSRKSRARATGAPGTPTGPAVTINPPRRAADPDAPRRPRPAAPRPGPVPRPAPSGAPFAGAPSPTGGNMASSAPVTRVTEAVHDAFGSFNPEKIVPDVEDFLASLDEIPNALSEAIKKLAARFDDELPVHADVPEGLREMIPALARLAEMAGEVNATFRSRHEQELKQHHEGRPAENAWNVG